MNIDATSKDDYRWLIPLVLENLGGRARAAKVLAEIEQDIHLKSADSEFLSNGEERWKNWELA